MTPPTYDAGTNPLARLSREIKYCPCTFKPTFEIPGTFTVPVCDKLWIKPAVYCKISTASAIWFKIALVLVVKPGTLSGPTGTAEALGMTEVMGVGRTLRTEVTPVGSPPTIGMLGAADRIG